MLRLLTVDTDFNAIIDLILIFKQVGCVQNIPKNFYRIKFIYAFMIQRNVLYYLCFYDIKKRKNNELLDNIFLDNIFYYPE